MFNKYFELDDIKMPRDVLSSEFCGQSVDAMLSLYRPNPGYGPDDMGKDMLRYFMGDGQ